MLRLTKQTLRDDYTPINIIARGQALTRKVVFEYIDSIEVCEYPISLRKEVDRTRNEEEDEENAPFDESTYRAKSEVQKLVRSNKWEWFITLTYDPKDFPSYDYDSVCQHFSKTWNTLKRKFPNLKYIAVPELHTDRIKYHFHMLIHGLPHRYFMQQPTNQRPNNHKLLLWEYFTSCEPVVQQSSDKIGFYIAKYFTSDFAYHFNKKRYFRTMNLDYPKVLYVGWVDEYTISPTSYVVKDKEGKIRYVKTRYEK